MRTANEVEVKEIFAEVDLIEPINVRRRVRLGEKIARRQGLTLYTRGRIPGANRAFNPFVRGLTKA